MSKTFIKQSSIEVTQFWHEKYTDPLNDIPLGIYKLCDSSNSVNDILKHVIDKMR